jgi:hypothetical protein
MSPISKSRDVTPAAIAGVVRNANGARKIIAHREQRDRMRMVFDFLGECIGDPSKTARLRPHAKF